MAGSWLESYPYYEDYQASPVHGLAEKGKDEKIMNTAIGKPGDTSRTQISTTIGFALADSDPQHARLRQQVPRIRPALPR